MDREIKYDYLIVGSGLFGAVCAHELTKVGKKCLVIDRRNHIAGNIYTTKYKNIDVHEYGAHIFHTNKKEIWDYINQFGEFNSFINSPIAISKGKTYNLPFNMNTFVQLWGNPLPNYVREKIKKQTKKYKNIEPKNLKQQALKLVGKDIYKTLIKEYTEKQWGKKCTELPPEIIKRLPIRDTYNNNYFDDKYQGVPKEGYTKLIEKMLEGIEVKLNTNFDINSDLREVVEKIIYTGAVDELCKYCYGKLEYRSLNFRKMVLENPNFLGNAVVNYIDKKYPYIRIIEHKHFNPVDCEQTIITFEYPDNYKLGKERFYPINNKDNSLKYNRYAKLFEKSPIILGGRLGLYKYLDMDDTIEKALELIKKEEKTWI